MNILQKLSKISKCMRSKTSKSGTKKSNVRKKLWQTTKNGPSNSKQTDDLSCRNKKKSTKERSMPQTNASFRRTRQSSWNERNSMKTLSKSVLQLELTTLTNWNLG